jgi:hypothetical protein
MSRHHLPQIKHVFRQSMARVAHNLATLRVVEQTDGDGDDSQ